MSSVNIEKNRKFLDIVSHYFAENSNNGAYDMENIFESVYHGDLDSFFCDSLFLYCGFPLNYLQQMKEGAKLKKKLAFEFHPRNKTIDEEPFSMYDELIKPYFQNFNKTVKPNGYSLYLYGSNSLGKTFTSLYLAYKLNQKSVMENKMLKYTFFYITFQNLMEIYLIGKFEKDPMMRQLSKTIFGCDFLIIDEMGKEGKNNNHIIVAAEQVIKARINNSLPTIFIGNMKPIKETPQDHSTNILDYYGQSVYAAMCEKCRFVYFSARENPDMRAKDSAWSFGN